MSDEQETLQELIERRRRDLTPRGEKLLSNRDLWRMGGGREHWSPQAVNNLVNGDTESLRKNTVERLALALGVSENEIRTAAGQLRHGKPFELPARAAALTAAERRILRDVMDAMLGKWREEDEPARRSRSLRSVEVPEPPAAVAARRGRSRGKVLIEAQDEDAESPSTGPDRTE